MGDTETEHGTTTPTQAGTTTPTQAGPITPTQAGPSPPETPIFNESTVGLYSPLIGEFSGDHTKDVGIKSFLQSIEDIAIACHWPDRVRKWVLRSKLKHKAALYFEQKIETAPISSFAEAKRLLILQYSKPDSKDYWRQLFDCRCFLGESISDYSNRLISLQNKCNSESMATDRSYVGDDKLLEIFLNGIPREIQEHMVVVTPRNMDDALQWTKQIEFKLSKLRRPKHSTLVMEVGEVQEDSSEELSSCAIASLKIEEDSSRAVSADRIMGALKKKEIAKKTKYTSKSSDMPKRENTKTVKSNGDTPSAVSAVSKRIIRDSTHKPAAGRRVSCLNKHMITIRIRGKELKCLIDPASDLTLVDKEVLSKLGLVHKVINSEPLELRSALNSRTVLDKSIDLYFILPRGNNQYIHTFRLLHREDMLEYGVIIGMDFLMANKAILNYEAKTLSLWGEVVATLEPYTGEPLSLEVINYRYLSEAEKIPNEVNKGSNKENTQRQIPIYDLFAFTVVPEKKGVIDSGYVEDVVQQTHATGKALQKLQELCKEHREVFVQEGKTLGVIKNFEHDIELLDSTPIKMPQYQVPVKLRGKFKNKLDEYISCGILEASQSPWNIPMIVKEKKNGDVRLILDATAINKKTKKIDYPIFRIEDTFTHLLNKKWFSTIDLRNGYHQIMLAPNARPLFAFRTTFGKYQFHRMPMGAANSGIFFQMVMEKLLAGLIGETLIIYQDDILIATCSTEEHLAILEKVLSIFKKEGIQINTEKSRFLVPKVNFLGHVIQDGSFSPSGENLEALRLLSPPRTVKQLRGFLGKVNFYAKFLPALSHRASPLTDLLTTSTRGLKWEDKHQKIFEEIRGLLCDRPVLHFPDFHKKFIISIQVSNSALVGVLEQEGDGGRYPIGYYSKKLSKPQKNYSTLDKNALAVISVLEHFRHIILGYEVEVCTGRKAVEYLRGLKDGNSRVSDWITKIATYAPIFTFNKDSMAITHILDMKEAVFEDDDPAADELVPTAYTDGSCSDNGQSIASAGVGVHWENCSLEDYFGHEQGCYTNNRAELAAIITALKMAIKAHYPKITIISDSKYALENITVNMLEWEKNDWKNARGKDIENIIDFRSIRLLLDLVSVDWRHTPGHAGVVGNELAHKLALKGRLAKDGGETRDIPPREHDTDHQVLAIRSTFIPLSKIIAEEEIIKEQLTDEHTKTLLQHCEEGLDTYVGEGIKLYKKSDAGIYARGRISITPGHPIQVNAIYVPKSLRKKVLDGIHLSKWVNHSGYVSTCEFLLQRYFWDSFRKDVRGYIRSCDSCQKSNAPRKKPVILEFEKPHKPGIGVALDIVGPIISSHEGYKYILSIIDIFSRHVTLCALRSIRTEDVLDAFERSYIAVFGVPESLVSDRGSNFTSEICKQVCSVLQMKHHLTSPYHPATNGMVERVNREIKKRLTTLCNSSGKTWASKLHLIQFALNNSYHSSINTSPNFLVFGEKRRFPNWSTNESRPLCLGTPELYVDKLRERLLEVRDIAWEYEKEVVTKRNGRINKNRFIPTYEVGDMVLYRSVRRGKTKNTGFKFIYEGPYCIMKRVSQVGYNIGIKGDSSEPPMTRRVHAERLRPYFVPTRFDDAANVDGQAESQTVGESIPSKKLEATPDAVPGTTITVNSPIETTTKPSPAKSEETDKDEALILGVDPPNHKYNTRSKSGRVRKCYRNFHTPNCSCP